MDDMIRILSVNKAAFLFSKGVVPEFELEETDRGYVISFVFPRTTEVHEWLNEFNDPKCHVNLHIYLKCFSELREMMKEYKKNNLPK